MRSFLYVIIDLIKNSKKENCNVLSNNVNTGIADYLYSKYEEYFVKGNFDKYKTQDVNEFYKNYIEEFDRAKRKYNCSNDEGLYLLLAIALNEIK